MPSSERWLLRGVRIDDSLLDCRLRDGRVAECAPGLAAHDGESVLDARGGALLPGLADHHLHLRALAAQRRSIDLRGTSVEQAARSAGSGVLRIIGADVVFTRRELDQWWPQRPVRVQHRSGALWTLNTAALDLVGEPVSSEERTTGQFWRASERLRGLSTGEGDDEDLRAVGSQLAARGITHVTDATPGESPPVCGAVPQRVLSMGTSGEGPYKIVIADHAPVEFERLVSAARQARRDDRGIALHAVSAPALAIAIAVLMEVGPDSRDRIEHAAVCTDEAARMLADLAVAVVTQPSVFARNGHIYRQESEADETDLLWRYGGLARLGVRIAVSSDAPYGDVNPWRTVHAAVTRSGTDGMELGLADERVSPGTALASMLTHPHDPAGPQRRVVPGAPADLCLLGIDMAAALDRAASGLDVSVTATFVGGRRVFSAAHIGDRRGL